MRVRRFILDHPDLEANDLDFVLAILLEDLGVEADGRTYLSVELREKLNKRIFDFLRKDSTPAPALEEFLEEFKKDNPSVEVIRAIDKDYIERVEHGTDHPYVDILVIPDSHASPKNKNDKKRYTQLNKLIHSLRQAHTHNLEVVLELGDFGDFESLCSHNPTSHASQLSLQEDITATKEACAALSEGLDVYKDLRLLAIRGNHENRVDRVKADHPQLHSVIPEDFTGHMSNGWTVIPFRTMLSLQLNLANNYKHMILAQHYFQSCGKPMVSGAAADGAGTLLRKFNGIDASLIMGHTHTHSVKIERNLIGASRIALIAGVFNDHSEDYATLDNNRWVRGVHLLRYYSTGSIGYHLIPIDEVMSIV
jgi:predicted phosphodiesterase